MSKTDFFSDWEIGSDFTLTYRDQIPESFLHYISVEFHLRKTQQSPLFQSEDDSYILKGHSLLEYTTDSQEKR